MNLVFGSLFIIGFGALILLLGVIAIAAISRSRGKHGTSGSLSSAALEIQSLEPEKKRVVETMRAEEESEDEDDRLQSPPR
jgi:hypothetical protein